jgi:glycosyltransferase involved in cell wall biosynthesis
MLAKNNAALIWHFHDPELIPVALWLSRKDVIVIWDAHEDYLSQFSDFGSKNWIPKPIRNSVKGLLSRLLTAIDRKASGVIAATPTIAGRYQNQRTVIVGNEVILDDFIDCQPKFESKRVLFTGSTGDSHLFSVVVDAMTRHPELLLVVAGRQKDDHAMREARLRLGDRLLYVGWLYRSELAEEMNRASIGFLTYADTDAYSVASPTKGFEFAAAGLPVVATPNQMNQRLLAEGGFGFLCQGFDAHSISSALKTALSDEQAWKNASMAGKKWCAENGSWTTSEKTLINFYDSLVSFHYSRNKTLRKSSANEW